MPSSIPLNSSIDDGLDRKHLKIITERFMQVNEGRLARTRLALNRQQQVFLDLLPILFHVNHPMLPGYVSHQTPHGVAGFDPAKIDVQRAQKLARSFNYRRQPTMLRQIHALFLMGSCGTVAQSSASDLDIWLCHGAELRRDDIIELKRKCHLLEHWAAELGLEAHFFVMDWDGFKRGERGGVSTEDCGSTQHYLLLDEFYRTGLLIAGRPPIWWLVPPGADEQHEHYADTLRGKRYIRPDETLDFGGVAQIPAGEFIGAGVWQLYKGIESPYKSVLKLLLTEVYASEYPQSQSLSQRFKKAIYSGSLDIDELDPYVMIYRRLEHYLLERSEYERLELVRRCFYLKVGKKLSKPPQHQQASWQRILLQKLVSEWGWTQQQLVQLDRSAQWKAPQVTEERKQLVRELTNSYRFLADFGRRSRSEAAINSHDMTILGRKLYATFERKAGKIDRINPGIASDLTEENLSLWLKDPVLKQPLSKEKGQDARDTALWSLHAEPLMRESPVALPLKRSDNLVELLAWGLINGVIGNQTHIEIAEGKHSLDAAELSALIRAMRQHLLSALPAPGDNSTFLQPAMPLWNLLFVNVGTDPMEAIRKRGLQRLSAQTDSLGYSGLRDNLVITLDSVSINSWGEVTCRHFGGAAAFLNCLREHLQSVPADGSGALPALRVFCFNASRGPAIATRVEELFRDVGNCYFGSHRDIEAVHGVRKPLAARYVLQVRSYFYVLQHQDRSLQISLARNPSMLLTALGSSQPDWSPIVLDRYALPGSALAAIGPLMRDNGVCVFFQQPRRDSFERSDNADEMPRAGSDQALVYVADERGSLLLLRQPFSGVQNLLHPLDTFLNAVLYRQNTQASIANTPLHENVLYFELTQSSPTQPLRAVSHDLNRTGDASTVLNGFAVQAIASFDASGKPVFTVYCDQQEFSALDHGDDLYREVARFIMSKRRSRERYPCYITDLDLSALTSTDAPASGVQQTIDYLRYKQLLEQGLNHALQNL
jgi:adenylate cyclase class 1